jgi:hypothetical protein
MALLLPVVMDPLWLSQLVKSKDRRTSESDFPTSFFNPISSLLPPSSSPARPQLNSLPRSAVQDCPSGRLLLTVSTSLSPFRFIS